MLVFQAEHNILMHPFHMLGVAGGMDYVASAVDAQILVDSYPRCLGFLLFVGHLSARSCLWDIHVAFRILRLARPRQRWRVYALEVPESRCQGLCGGPTMMKECLLGTVCTVYVSHLVVDASL